MALPTLNTPTYELTLPSTGEKIPYRPFLVKEEKVLLMATEGDDPKAMVRALSQIVENCTMGKIKADNHPLFDLEYIFLKLRGKSIGETVEPTYKSPDCDKPVILKIDLNEVEVVKAEGHTNKVALTDKVGVTMKYPSLKQAEMAPQINPDDPNFALEVIVDCIDHIYDETQVYPAKDHSRQEMEAFVENLTQDQFIKISEFFNTMPKMEHRSKYICPCTGEEKEVVLTGLQDFFGLASATTT